MKRLFLVAGFCFLIFVLFTFQEYHIWIDANNTLTSIWIAPYRHLQPYAWLLVLCFFCAYFLCKVLELPQILAEMNEKIDCFGEFAVDERCKNCRWKKDCRRFSERARSEIKEVD